MLQLTSDKPEPLNTLFLYSRPQVPDGGIKKLFTWKDIISVKHWYTTILYIVLIERRTSIYPITNLYCV